MKFCPTHQAEAVALLDKTVIGNRIDTMLMLCHGVGLKALDLKLNTPEDVCPLCKLDQSTWLEEVTHQLFGHTILCQIHREEIRRHLNVNVARNEPWDWARIQREIDKNIPVGETCSICRLLPEKPYSMVSILQDAFSSLWTYTCGHCGKSCATHDTLQPEGWFSNTTPKIDSDDPRVDRHFACSEACRSALIERRNEVVKKFQEKFRADLPFHLNLDVLKDAEDPQEEPCIEETTDQKAT